MQMWRQSASTLIWCLYLIDIPCKVAQASHSVEQLQASNADISSENEAKPLGVTWRVYWNFFQAAGAFWALPLILVTNLMYRVSYLCFDYYSAIALSSAGVSVFVLSSGIRECFRVQDR